MFSMLLSMFCLTALAADVKVNNGDNKAIYYKYNEDRTALLVTAVDEGDPVYSGAIVIPERVEIEGTPLPVIGIDAWAFNRNTEITSVSLPSGITSIGMYAFAGCTGLANVTLPETLTSIGDNAFNDCTTFTAFTLPASVTSLGISVLEGCLALTEVNLPQQLTAIPDGMFSGCIALAHIDIPSGVTSLGEYAFDDCRSLTNVVLPDALTELKWGAFRSCSSLTAITIPQGVTVIGEEAFKNCLDLAEVTLPNALTTISPSAFESTVLKKITLPETLSEIGEYAFRKVPFTEIHAQMREPKTHSSNCFSFKSYSNATLYVPKGTKESYQQTEPWDSFENIEEEGDDVPDTPQEPDTIAVANDMGTILYYAFNETRDSLIVVPVPADSTQHIYKGEITVPSTVVWKENTYPVLGIGDEAFKQCEELTAVTVSEGIRNLGYECLSENPALERVTLPNSLVFCDYYIFSECTALKEVTLPPLLDMVNVGLFYGCSALTTVNLPQNIKVIEYAAFKGCTALTNLTLPDGLTSILQDAFLTTGLKSITLPATIETMEPKCFHETMLDEVHALYDEPLPFSNELFDPYTYENGKLIVPDGKIDVYKDTDGWRPFKTIVDNVVLGVDLNKTVSDAPQYYHLDGRKANRLVPGVYVVKRSNGEVKKVMIR